MHRLVRLFLWGNFVAACLIAGADQGFAQVQRATGEVGITVVSRDNVALVAAKTADAGTDDPPIIRGGLADTETHFVSTADPGLGGDGPGGVLVTLMY